MNYRGVEYTLREFKIFCKYMRIHYEIISLCIPQRNDLTERNNMTIMNITIWYIK